MGLRDLFLVAPAGYHHHHHHQINGQHHATPTDQLNGAPPSAASLGFGVIPLLTAAPLHNIDDSANANMKLSTGIHLWQSQTHHQPTQSPGSFVPGGPAASGNSGSGSSTCQDCGNQAKKECSHRRCRTCCKSRGFDCPTHVKSTWVPAARRRERQLLGAGAGSSVSTSGAKKPRLVSSSHQQTTSHTSNSNTTPPRSFDTSSSHQDVGLKEGWPRQIRAPAVFKCVRVTALEDGEDEYAYQAVVKIGGHVFKGFLYDQGVEQKDSFLNFSELHLGGGGGGRNNSNTNNNNTGTSSSPIVDPSDVYAASGGGGLLGGLGYGNQMS